MNTRMRLKASDGHELDACFAESRVPARGAIVLVQEIFGVNSHIRSVADDYAGQGFHVVAPALFDRVQPNLELGYNPTGNGDTRNPVRPSWNPDFHGSLYPRTPSQYFNPRAFIQPASGTYGNVSRDALTGPGLSELDFSALKKTRLTERLHLQFRAEFFNILNHTNFLTPNPVVFSSGPQQSTTAAIRTQAAVLSPTAGVVTAAATSRQVQFGLKLLF